MGTNITGIGNANAIGFKSRVTGGAYFPPELKDALVGVWSAYGKSNDSTDRNIIKNKIKDRGGDFVISNAAYEGMSGYNGYPVVFGANKTWDQMPTGTFTWNIEDNKLHITKALIAGNGLLFSYVKLNGSLLNVKEIPSFKIKVSGLEGKSKLWYRYLKTEDAISETIAVLENGTHELPKSYIPSDSLHNGVWVGFTVTPISEGVKEFDCDITIEVLPEYEGAFVTDGIDDLITSTKTVQEMLGGSNEITVVSMMANLDSRKILCNSNYSNTNGYNVRNTLEPNGVITMLGYTDKNGTTNNLNLIMGDKDSIKLVDKVNFNSDYIFYPAQYYKAYYQVAWYWTIIANKVLTTDQINQVIAYFNLDRTLKPDILCDVKKQGITNDNHAEFGDKLIDFSGNGRDIQLNNIAWDGDSGIGKYNYPNWKVNVTQGNKYARIVYYDSINGTYSADFKGMTELYKSYGLSVEIRVNRANTVDFHSIKEDGIYTVTPPDDTTSIDIRFGGENVYNASCDITITQIPSHAGGLCLDGINDFGKVTGMPVYKDYTVVANRELFNAIGCVLSNDNPGAFIFETSSASAYSFGEPTTSLKIPTDKQIRYQTKYSYNGQNISIGAVKEGTSNMWLGTTRDNDARFRSAAIYSLMSFPYSMSEFLIERQLKKYKLGTLYPNMVEFRPVIKANANYKITYYQIDSTNTWKSIKVGDYIVIGAKLAFQITFDNDDSELKEVVSPQLSGIIVEKRPSNPGYNIYSYITSKSPQKINITIDEYIRFEDIVQPYPVLLRFKDENGNEVSWGGKFRVGSTITRIGSAADSNLLPSIYNIFGLLLNGNQVTSSKVIVEKTMVFKPKSAYIFDNNEPKCILSPRLLRIPNSSYKILGHIPDISGHGNNGKINNSAYEGMSGVNGYPVVFGKNKTWANESNGYVTNITSNTIHITNVLNAGLALLYSYVKYNGNLQNIKEIPPFKIEIKGLEGRSKFIYKYLATSDATKETNLYLGNGTHELPKSFLPTEALINNAVVGFSISPIEEGVTNFLSDITIKVLPEYEGAYCLDGVDDFVTIPTATGGKQVFMKVNSRKSDCYLYDQRNNWTQYLGIVSTKDFIAYNYSNQRGKTYIDGILNENITANDLIDITHNITVTNNRDDVKQYSPCIGTSFARNSFAQMALYDFMLFDNISTDDKIKELNEYIGLSGNIFEFNPPTFTIDLPMAIKSIKVYQGGNEISPGYLYPNKDTEFEVYVSLNDGKYAVDTITVDGVEITKDRVVGEYNIFKFILNGSSEQKIKIHSYEYIMYEDINQPYPVIFKVKDRTTNQIYSWGDRIKIGSSIQLIHGENPNLLPELYSIISYTYEGNSYSYNQLTNLVITVTKTISVSCQKTWKLGSNEPKCILSPKRLKLANSSYKYLGYIPDISGNGNNGVFNNFAFSGMSGANGYTYEYTNTSDFSVLSQYARTINSEKIEFFGYINAVTFYRKNPTYKGKIKIEGLTSAISSGKVQHFQIYTNSKTNTETSVFKTDGVYDIDVTGIGDATNVYFYVLPANTSESGTLDNPITIEQVGNYEGAICFDGIDDYVTIPTLSKGGKQVLMKVNWNTINSIIYDQRGSGGFAIYCSDYNNPSDPITVPAYKGRNAAGTTYIDGIRNEYIIASQLRNVTHNIVEILDTSYAAGNINPIIGKSYLNANYGKMSLYDFVLFDEVSTDEEIKQLNDIIGIEGDYVQKPDYYWDAYGKSNFDADRDTIQQRGVAVGNYDLTNYNHAYDKMSGYGGYSLGRFDKSWSSSNNTSVIVVSRNPYDITLKKLGGNSDWEFNNTELKVISNPVSVKFKSNKNIRVTCDYHYYPVGGNSEGTPLGITSKDLIANKDAIITISPISQENIDKYNIDVNRGYYLIYFQLSSTLAVNEEVTIEMLPLYPNGLVYDGVDDYSENASIPLLSDYTYIFKRTLLNKKYNSASIFKGSNKQSGGGAFICDYNSVEPDLLTQGFSFGAGLYVDSLNADSIVYGTRGSVNGTKITAGNNTDTEGLTVGKWRAYKEMVFYKLFLYPRTVNMLSINMVKNMMEEDGIIDLTSKLFTDKYTGDFYEMDFNNDFLIGN